MRKRSVKEELNTRMRVYLAMRKKSPDPLFQFPDGKVMTTYVYLVGR